MTLPEPARTLLLQGWPALETSGFARRFGARRTASLTAQAATAREGDGLYEEERGRETAIPRPTPPP